MKGTVKEINHSRGMVAVMTEEDYSIFELLGEEDIEQGDQVSWNEIRPLGSEKIKNLTKGNTFEVYFQNHWVKELELDKQLLK